MKKKGPKFKVGQVVATRLGNLNRRVEYVRLIKFDPMSESFPSWRVATVTGVRFWAEKSLRPLTKRELGGKQR